MVVKIDVLQYIVPLTLYSPGSFIFTLQIAQHFFTILIFYTTFYNMILL